MILTQVNLPRPGNRLLLIGDHLHPLGQPAHRARNGKHHREHGRGQAHRLVNNTGVEVHVGIQLPLHKILVLQRNPLQLQGNIQHRVPAGHIKHLVRHLLNQPRPRVVVLVYPVAEAHQAELARLHPAHVIGNVGHAANLVQHPQHRFVGSTVQRAIQRRRRRRYRAVRIHPRTPHRTHGIGATVLLVVGMQNEQHIQRPHQCRVRLVLRLHHPEHHGQEIGRVAQVIVRVIYRKTHAVTIRQGRQRGHLGNQPVNLQHPHLRIGHILGLRIEG